MKVIDALSLWFAFEEFKFWSKDPTYSYGTSEKENFTFSTFFAFIA